jgi:tetratricopeptide (TPR) repeat protein
MLPALAILNDDRPQREATGDPDYAAALAALNREDWPRVIEHLANVIQRRPWHDDAYNLMGFAYRQLGQYPKALEYYQKALDLNPYHRGVLEYLGETYLAMGCPAQARQTLEQLAVACQRAAGTDSSGQVPCEAWQELQTALDAYRQPATTGYR